MAKTIPVDSFDLIEALINLTGELEHDYVNAVVINRRKLTDYQDIAKQYLERRGFDSLEIDDFLSGEEQLSDYVQGSSHEEEIDFEIGDNNSTANDYPRSAGSSTSTFSG